MEDLSFITSADVTLDDLATRITSGWQATFSPTRRVLDISQPNDEAAFVKIRDANAYLPPALDDPGNQLLESAEGFPRHIQNVRYFDVQFTPSPGTRELLAAIADSVRIWVDMKKGPIVAGPNLGNVWAENREG